MGPSFRYSHRHTIERLEDKIKNNPVSSEVIVMDTNKSPPKNKYPKYLLTGRSSSGSKKIITTKDPTKETKKGVHVTLDHSFLQKRPEKAEKGGIFGHKRNTTNQVSSTYTD